MINQLNMIIGGVVLVALVGVGWYVKSLNDKVITCKANTSIQKNKYEKDIAGYKKAIDDIVDFYDKKIEDIDTFKRRDDETDCEAGKRFLDSFSY